MVKGISRADGVQKYVLCKGSFFQLGLRNTALGKPRILKVVNEREVKNPFSQ